MNSNNVIDFEKLHQITRPNRPLTLKEINDMYDFYCENCNVIGVCGYMESREMPSVLYACVLDYDADGKLVAVWNAGCEENGEEKLYNKMWRFWVKYPAPEERALYANTWEGNIADFEETDESDEDEFNG